VVYQRLWIPLWTAAVRRTWLVLAGIALAAAFLSPFGVIRTLIALVMGAAILVFGVRYMHSVVSAPPEPELADVSEYGLKYVCTMCGLELKVEVAAKDKAPSHCMEPMVLVRSGGKPPLRPV
jgi:hypothetical protein